MATNEYVVPKVWVAPAEVGGTFGSMNRPTAGARSEKELEVGKHPLQLYSLGTPNGQKVTIMLEELLAAGVKEAEYDAWIVPIMELQQFTTGFVKINPNSKIPAFVDRSDPAKPVSVFESGAILLYLAEKFHKFIPADPQGKASCLSWLMWQMSCGPVLGGGFGHFYSYAPVKLEYPINRFAMDVKRQFDVLDKQLADNKFICGDEITIADFAIFPWYGNLCLGKLYGGADEFLSVAEYKNVVRWSKELAARQAVKRGRIVNRVFGPMNEQLKERHDASDFDLRTEDKLNPEKWAEEQKKAAEAAK